MPATDITYFTAYEDTSPCLLARVTGNAGTAITQATIGGIALSVYNKANMGTPVASAVALTVSSVVFDTLQTDAKWTEDSTGYNFAYDVPVAYLPSPGTYEYEFVFTPTSGGAFVKRFQGEILDRRSG